MTVRSVGTHTKEGRTGRLWTANPVLGVKPPVAFLHLSAAALSCSALTVCLQLWAWAKGWWARPWPGAKLPVAMSPESLLKSLSTLHSWFMSYDPETPKKRRPWMKWGHSGSGGLLQASKLATSMVCGWKAPGPSPSCSPALHCARSNPLSHFRNYGDLKKKKSMIILRGFLREKSDPRHSSFRIKQVNGRKGQEGGVGILSRIIMGPKSMGGRHL